MAEIVNLSARRRSRSGAEAALTADRAIHEILMSIKGRADSLATVDALARGLFDREISAELFGSFMQMVINRLLEIERAQPDGAA